MQSLKPRGSMFSSCSRSSGAIDGHEFFAPLFPAAERRLPLAYEMRGLLGFGAEPAAPIITDEARCG